MTVLSTSNVVRGHHGDRSPRYVNFPPYYLGQSAIYFCPHASESEMTTTTLADSDSQTETEP